MTESADLFSALEDPRASNARRHSLHDILVIAFCAMLCGGQTCTDMELFGHAKRELLQSFLKLDHGIPSRDTFSRLLGMLDPAAFQQWFIGFMRQFAEGNEACSQWTGKLCAVLTTMRSSVPRCIWSALGPRSSGRRWGKWPWTTNPTRLRRCPVYWKC